MENPTHDSNGSESWSEVCTFGLKGKNCVSGVMLIYDITHTKQPVDMLHDPSMPLICPVSRILPTWSVNCGKMMIIDNPLPSL